MQKISLFKTDMGEEEVNAIRDVLLSGWVALGPKTAEFEKKYAEFIGTKYAVGVNSCTAALHLAFLLYDFPKGSEVLMSAINFISAPHSASYCGLKPVFVDVDPGTLSMDVNDLERKITSNTKAIIVTHLGGTPAAMRNIMRIAKDHNLIVIEDVANAVGGSYDGKMLGSIGDIGCHSFEAKKNMTTGDGGMVTLNDEELNQKLRRLRWLGINKDTWKRFSEKEGNYDWYYEVSELGYKYNMNDIMASIGIVQLRRLPELLRIKDDIIARYNDAFKDIDWVKTPEIEPNGKGAYWLYIVQVPERDKFISYLGDKGITTGVHFMPMHLHPLYRQDARTPVADKVWRNIVSLPLFTKMTKEEQEYIIGTIKDFGREILNK